MNISIRLATYEDATLVWTLRAKLTQHERDSGSLTADQMTSGVWFSRLAHTYQMFCDGGVEVYIAVDSERAAHEQAVGVVVLRDGGMIGHTDGRVVTVEMMYVEPEYRDGPVTFRLLRQVQRRVKQAKATKLQWATYERNGLAAQMWTRHARKAVPVAAIYEWGLEDEQ